MTSRLSHWRRHSAEVAEVKVLANHDDVTGREYETRHPALTQPSPVSSGPRGRLVHSNQVPLGLEFSHLELGGVGHGACFCPEDGSLENRPKTTSWILRPNGGGVPARGEGMRYTQGNKSQGSWAAAMRLVLPPRWRHVRKGRGPSLTSRRPDPETWLYVTAWDMLGKVLHVSESPYPLFVNGNTVGLHYPGVIGTGEKSSNLSKQELTFHSK